VNQVIYNTGVPAKKKLNQLLKNKRIIKKNYILICDICWFGFIVKEYGK
jgi:hypothetical protein